jgi:hypothetical protein
MLVQLSAPLSFLTSASSGHERSASDAALHSPPCVLHSPLSVPRSTTMLRHDCWYEPGGSGRCGGGGGGGGAGGGGGGGGGEGGGGATFVQLSAPLSFLTSTPSGHERSASDAALHSPPCVLHSPLSVPRSTTMFRHDCWYEPGGSGRCGGGGGGGGGGGKSPAQVSMPLSFLMSLPRGHPRRFSDVDLQPPLDVRHSPLNVPRSNSM